MNVVFVAVRVAIYDITGNSNMKNYLSTLFQNDLLLILLNGVILHTAFCATVSEILQIPPEAILDSGLKEILMIFEG